MSNFDLDDINGILGLALTKGLSPTKPSVDVTWGITDLTKPNGVKKNVLITCAYTKPASAPAGQIWLDSNVSSNTYKTFFVGNGSYFVAVPSLTSTTAYTNSTPVNYPLTAVSLGGLVDANSTTSLGISGFVPRTDNGADLKSVLFGDSTANQTFVGNTALTGSFVVILNGIATVTLTSNHNSHAGEVIQVIITTNLADQVAQSNFNYNTTILSTPQNNQITFATQGINDGSYPAQVNGVNWSFNFLNSMSDTSWIAGLEMFSPRPSIIVGSYAVGGSLSSNLLIPLSRAFAPGAPSFNLAYVSTGYNNINTATPATSAAVALTSSLAAVDQVISDLTTFLLTMEQHGIQVRAFIPAGINTNATGITYQQQRLQAFAELRKRMYALQIRFRNLALIDGLYNTMDVTGYLQTGMATLNDGLHPQNAATIQHGRLGAYQLKLGGALGVQNTQPVCIFDDTATYPGATENSNVLKNGMMTGSVAQTAGALGATASIVGGSTMPTGWTLDNSSSNCAITSTAQQPLVAGTGEIINPLAGYGLNLSAVFSAGGVLTVRSSDLHANIEAGFWYRLTGRMVVTSTVNTFRTFNFFTFESIGVACAIKRDMTGTSNQPATLIAGDVINLTGALFYVPPGTTYTSFYMYFQFAMQAAGTLAFQMSNMRLEKLINNPFTS